ncbi:MAG TPA: adenylate/guanylate cyclase domain-containing protein [Salinivirgaceae bacterium]|nr:adenylate/guanylate cyclase domain-containing protein [Salinivirgaceae bacterium]
MSAENQNSNLVQRLAKLMVENKELSQQLKKLQEEYNKLQEENDRLNSKIEHLKQKGAGEAEGIEITPLLRFKMATVLFVDIQGFSKIHQENNSHEIIDELDSIFFEFDQIAHKYKIERIKTIGDTYMCAGGVPVKNITNPIDVVLAALEMRFQLFETEKKRRQNGSTIWEIRMGMHTGPVIATTMGKKKVSYNIKGDTVNIASRMQAASQKGDINISVTTYELVREYFECEYIGIMPVKYTGNIEMYKVLGLKKEFAADPDGIFPNQNFTIKYLLRQFSDLQEIILDKLEKELPPYLYYHNFKHTIDVISQVELIGIGEGVNDNDLLLLKTAALFHDAGHTVGYDNHEFLGTQIAREILPQYKYTPEQIDTICELIMATKLPPNPKNLLEKIMCDADLDYLGRSDFIPVSNTLFEELKAQNKINDINEWNKIQVKFISNHQYFTETANRLREVNKQKQIERIKKLIK